MKNKRLHSLLFSKWKTAERLFWSLLKRSLTKEAKGWGRLSKCTLSVESQLLGLTRVLKALGLQCRTSPQVLREEKARVSHTHRPGHRALLSLSWEPVRKKISPGFLPSSLMKVIPENQQLMLFMFLEHPR